MRVKTPSSTDSARRLPVLPAAAERDLAHALARELRGEVRFDQGTRALYATDASNYRQMPIGVVLPRDIDDVVAAVEICRRFDAPLVSRGGGTSLAGQGCNAAVLLDFSKYLHHVLDIDPARRVARVEPGVVLDDLREQAERHHLTFGPDPATHNHCTLGGMIGNNSCGVHSLMAGCTAQNVESLDILTYDGERWETGATDAGTLDAIFAAGGRRAEIHARLLELRDRYEGDIRDGFPHIPRRVSGYDLPALLPENGFHVARALVGSEGTLVTILGATLRLVPSPAERVLLVLGYPSVFDAADDVPRVLESGPIGLEGLDAVLVDDMKRKGLHPRDVQLLPPGGGWLLVEFGDDTARGAEAQARRFIERLARRPAPPSAKLFTDRREAALVWTVRESGLGATARVPGEADTWEGWEDAAVAPDRLGGYLREFRALLDRYAYRAALYGHFGQGCVHTRIPFDLRTPAGIARFRSFVEEAAALVVRHGGSLSGEHGDGQSRAELLPLMFRPELMRAFREFKAIWDPSNRMNPGKVVEPYRLDEHLRLGPVRRAMPARTHFRFPGDGGSFAYATERCVGVGECRRLGGGTMCPSYMVTREEAHSTRGRARLLFEMMRGGVAGGWRSEAVREALDLCLSCKGCRHDCPVNVDMATYKAEFLSHYYARRLRPRSAWAFGLVSTWARIGSVLPRMANRVLRSPLLSPVLNRAAGVAPERRLPQFAPRTFRRRWSGRRRTRTGQRDVLLWADTFNNYWEPAVLEAAGRVLEDAGFRVLVSQAGLCCGRPLYDYGMLGLAVRRLRRILRALRSQIRAGVPVVGVEPSCIAVFRDELVNLLPDDEDARALSRQSWMLDEFLAREAPGWSVPGLGGRVLVHGHCHQKALMGMDHEMAMLAGMGAEAELLDSGCCGMAGSFGYERAHYAVSVACGERSLLPAVRNTAADTVIVADGFSCREQIRQQTAREPVHLAQVLATALDRHAGGRA